MEHKELTAEDSLAIITRMVQGARMSLKGSSFYFLLWGWVVVLGHAGHYTLAVHTSADSPYLIWLITIPAWIITFIYSMRHGKKESVRTYSSIIIQWTWIAISFSLLIALFAAIRYYPYLINPLILVVIAPATFLSGVILKFRPLIYGGSLFWIFAVICASVQSQYQPLVSAIAIIAGYLIPGYMLKRQEQNESI